MRASAWTTDRLTPRQSSFPTRASASVCRDERRALRFPRESGGGGPRAQIVIGEIMSEIGSRNTCCVIAFFSRARRTSSIHPSILRNLSRGSHATQDGNIERREKVISRARMRRECARWRKWRRMASRGRVEGGRPFETESLHCETNRC